MAAATEVTRAAWLGHRWRRHGLAGAPAAGWADLLLLGFQDSRGGGAEQSLAQRGWTGGAVRPDGPVVRLWSVRGAPHVHRVRDLDAVRDALAPLDDDDDGGPAQAAAVREVAAALTAVLTGPTAKGEASAAVTARVDRTLLGWCPRCRSDHVPDGTFRAAGRQAGVLLGPGGDRSTMLHPRPDHPQDPVPDRPRQSLVEAYLRVNGPATRPLVRDWMEAGTTAAWPGVVLVRVDGRRAELPGDLLDEVRTAPPAEGVALVPPHDPYLRQVDRTLLVPDRDRRGQVWKALSAPGALLVDGEVAGTWRYRRAERALTITPFAAPVRADRGRGERGDPRRPPARRHLGLIANL